MSWRIYLDFFCCCFVLFSKYIITQLPTNISCSPDRRRPPVDGGGAVRSGGITSRCEPGRVSTADIVEDAGRMRINKKRNLRTPLNGMSRLSRVRAVLVLVRRSFVKGLTVMVKSWTPSRWTRVRHVYSHGKISDVEGLHSADTACVLINVPKQRHEWASADAMTQYLSVYKHVSSLEYNDNIVDQRCHI